VSQDIEGLVFKGNEWHGDSNTQELTLASSATIDNFEFIDNKAIFIDPTGNQFPNKSTLSNHKKVLAYSKQIGTTAEKLCDLKFLSGTSSYAELNISVVQEGEFRGAVSHRYVFEGNNANVIDTALDSSVYSVGFNAPVLSIDNSVNGIVSVNIASGGAAAVSEIFLEALGDVQIER
jgi:hypothetical protein